ncbi:MAG: hypothetical protein UY53_C0004G0025 [Parcubacteria group bacterium GW2011_GWA2_50_10]|uniref:Uncharacterized protein n=1 Tax=Candidatus Yanofskybacteria bacterium GW2011_GWC1_48_11 TaxID=1619027 RepID=A0A837IM60_9BACT|nr:MAG: hypothetical protein UY25_C0001G0086 [Candidatus Yanofskybacteria bacterium GW2011_GWC1_48_11]KKW03940.1 MAG: hypothetical protein UY38_C0002G0094 [Parcubacteria group bacterium GW2011_GWB1_49_12]KKW08714.1 MAG: hypothetical protein UY45_C0004G0044 [Parcubacteria group bacterium GW2011_GWA1_49_26]KKW13974.1 MAG: hypothetical protein UY53_C0004G0025 [Parcubacteria group bacterium GW2011_GWA2_50_10]
MDRAVEKGGGRMFPWIPLRYPCFIPNYAEACIARTAKNIPFFHKSTNTTTTNKFRYLYYYLLWRPLC